MIRSIDFRVVAFQTLSIFALLSAACGGAVPSETAASPASNDSNANAGAGGSVSDFTLDDINGKPVALSDYLNQKVVVLSFWAPCCESGREKTKDSQALYEAYSDKGLMVLAITADEPERRGEVRSFAKQRKITIPILLDSESRVMDQLNPKRYLPYTLVIDRSGEIAWSHEGYSPGDDKLIEDAVRKILAAEL